MDHLWLLGVEDEDIAIGELCGWLKGTKLVWVAWQMEHGACLVLIRLMLQKLNIGQLLTSGKLLPLALFHLLAELPHVLFSKGITHSCPSSIAFDLVQHMCGTLSTSSPELADHSSLDRHGIRGHPGQLWLLRI